MATRDARGAHPVGDDDVDDFKNPEDGSTGLFDLRYLIGGLFTVYGIVLVIAGFFVSTEKSNGININLWLGIGMFVLGAGFLLWARTRPLEVAGRSALAEAEDPAPSR